jgi:diguanylate cyclase (GGDEF)-like protein
VDTFYAIILTISATISLAVAVVVWRRRKAPGASGLALYMLAMFVWAGTYAVRWSLSDPAAQYFWLDLTYLGVVAAPYLSSVFALQYTGRGHLLTRPLLILLAIEPVLTLVVLFTDSYHGLFYAGLRSTGVINRGGWWFWFNVYYSYAIYLVMLALIARQYLRSTHLYRRQTASVLLGMLLPWLGTLWSISGHSPFTNMDITPFIFILSGMVIAYGLFEYRLMDLVPVAREKLIESLPDGVLVLDGHQRIVDINPAAFGLLNAGSDLVGKLASKALSHLPALEQAFYTKSEIWLEMRVSHNPARDIEVRVTPLFGSDRGQGGQLILLRDITVRKLMEEKLRQLSLHDSLTGLYNRVFFDEELARLERRRRFPVSLVLADVDNLKSVNDQQGHAAGDEVLRQTAFVLTNAFRAEDVITRIGGDEFVVILPNTDAEAAAAALDRVRQVLQENNAAHPATQVNISFGASTAEVNTPLSETLKDADADMYRQKRLRRSGSDGTAWR